MRNFPQLAETVQRNCDISDARHAGEYGLCTFLLKMREYYRWENELPFGRIPSPGVPESVPATPTPAIPQSSGLNPPTSLVSGGQKKAH